jgi:hypothetical protein
MSLKEKLRVILNQTGDFKCPNGGSKRKTSRDHIGTTDDESIQERVALVVADLQRRGAARPRTLRTLSSTINALFQKQLAPAEIAALLEELQENGTISINQGKVSYALPSSGA